VLPRGVFDAAVQILEEAGASVVVQDHRDFGSRCTWSFAGELRPEQGVAVRAMARHEIGVLCAPPGSGKTVMGCVLIAQHRTAVLVLVHRSVLLDQWRDAAMQFLGLKKKEVGIWRGSKPRLTRRLDIAMLPSLARIEDYSAAFKGYGLVLIDECHHVPAASFELLLKACPARRVYGLTATPNRKDRLEKLLHLQCGPIRHTVASDVGTPDGRVVMVRRSSIAIPQGNQVRPSIHEVWNALVRDQTRLMQIVADIEACISEGRSPLVLADRKVYLDSLAALLHERATTPAVVQFRLQSGIGKKQRAEIRSQIDEHFAHKRPFVLLATASLIGEGFDLPQLDTLVLSMPLSFKGRLVQYVGRLHRSHEGKASPRVYDYLDENSPLTRAMFRRRLVGYRQMGYRVEFPGVDAFEANDIAGVM
jgi:superfamily II DNA or RNA helicase